MTLPLLCLCFLLAVAGILFEKRKSPALAVIRALYPLTLLGFCLGALTLGLYPVLAAGLLLGLFFCIPGIFILTKRNNDGFLIYGLGSLLLARLIYGLSFLSQGQLCTSSIGPLVFLAAMAYLQFSTFRKLPSPLKGPIIAYIGVVSLMLFGATAFVLGPNPSVLRKMVLLTGAFLLYVSDSLIGHDLFRISIPHSYFFILPAYYIGHFLVVFQLFL